MTEVFGTDAFYSLDVGWDSVKKEYFVIEANSCSGLNSHTVEVYADYLMNDNSFHHYSVSLREFINSE